MAEQQIRVGIIGANPERGWGVTAHLPALAKLPQYAVTAACTTRRERRTRRQALQRAPCARRLAPARHARGCRPRHHRGEGGSSRGTGRGRGRRRQASSANGRSGSTAPKRNPCCARRKTSGVKHMVGLQGRANPTLNFIRDLVRDGHVGEVISYTFTSSLANSGAEAAAGRSLPHR